MGNQKSLEKILVVEDREENLNAAKEAFGDKAVYYSNPEEALQRLDKEKFDYVLTDMIMPKPEGYSIEKFWEAYLQGDIYYKDGHFSEDKVREIFNEKVKKCNADINHGPLGLDIAVKAIEKGMPIAIVSHLGHHSEHEYAYHIAGHIFGVDWQDGGYNPEKKVALMTNYTFYKKEEFKNDPEDWKKSLELLQKCVKELKETVSYYKFLRE